LAFREPWSPADATTAIRKLALHERFTITLAHHAQQRRAERDLNMGDLLYVLKNGFLYEPPETSDAAWSLEIQNRDTLAKLGKPSRARGGDSRRIQKLGQDSNLDVGG
jgi:hypothetical protein